MENTKQMTKSLQTLQVDNESRKPDTTYKALESIGSGSFGTVYKVEIQETKEIVAIKKVFQDKRYKNRELQIMKELSHPNVINLRNYFYSQGEKKDECYLNLVMNYMSETLSKLIRQYYKSRTTMPMLLVKLYSYQMLRSLIYLDTKEICHRDIKPQNILVDPKSQKLQICDLGSAKKLVPGEPNVAYICSRYYRAPELIFGQTDYTTAIDTWSIGCVIVELVLGRPLFPGENSVDQLVEIIKILGTPTKTQILAMNPNYGENKFPNIKPYPWMKLLRKHTVPKEFIDLISELLVYEPKKRTKPMIALLHPFFDELKLEKTKLPNGNELPDLFNFLREEIEVEPSVIEKIVPSWYKPIK